MCCRGQFVAKNLCELSERFNVGKTKVGQGGRGRVFWAFHVRTERQYAVKAISKKAVEGTCEYPSMEINIMKSLDHPNIVKLFETFADEDYVYLVMEACRGGAIGSIKQFTEDEVALVMKQVLYAVRYMHKVRTLHGDLNIENILLESKAPLENNCIKIVDFGTAKRTFSFDADIEACGAVLRALLGKVASAPKTIKRSNSGNFVGLLRSSSGVFTASGVEVDVSREARDLVHNFQGPFPCSIASALSHAWFQKRAPRELKPEQAKWLPSIVDRMKRFDSHNRFKRAVIHIIADRVPGEQIRLLRDTFTYLDRNSDGVITPKEVKARLNKVCSVRPSGVTAAMKAVDADDVGALEYTAFLAAVIGKNLYESESLCKDAFDVFDRDGNGQISMEEIADFLCDKAVKGSMTAKRITKMVQEDLDQNGDGVVSFNEFLGTMRNDPSMASGMIRTKVDKAAIDAMTASATPLERAEFVRVKRLAVSAGSVEAKQKDGKTTNIHKNGKNKKTACLKRPCISDALTTAATAASGGDIGNLDDLADFEDLEDVVEEDEEDDDDYDSEEDMLGCVHEEDEDDGVEEMLLNDAPPVPPPTSQTAMLFKDT